MEAQLTISNVSGKNAVNKYENLQTKSLTVREAYVKVFEAVEGSYTVVSDNDAVSKINMAISTLNPNKVQQGCLTKFRDTFSTIEGHIDPTRLKFTIEAAMDEEICITHFASIGISKIIIHDDGLIAHSFIGYKGSEKKDFIIFYSTEEKVDYESLTYKFFSV
jgi:hypothetical protein